MAIMNLVSYELNGVKESFANWISNLSPTETPFTSMTGKEAVKNKYYQWQEDQLTGAGANAVAEGSDAVNAVLKPTSVKHNVTQILRKVVQVSDTANALSSYGRGKEMQYQLEKAGKEIKRDLEFAFLNNGDAVDGSATVPRQFAGFASLVAPLNAKSPEDNAAIVHQSGNLTEENIFSVTTGLYLAGACTDIIMFHPSHASFFSGLMEKGDTRIRMFDGASDTKLNKYVSTLVDPLGCSYKLIPNRFMPVSKIYFFSARDWTQMVLRAPNTQLLAKTGSFDKYMIEMEVGLRHRNQFASGILEVVVANGDAAPDVTQPPKTGFPTYDGTNVHNGIRLYTTTGAKTQQIDATKANGAVGELTYVSSNNAIASVDDTGLITAHTVGKARISVSTGGAVTIVNVYVFTDNTVIEHRFERDTGLTEETSVPAAGGIVNGGAIASIAADQSKVVYKWFKGVDKASATEWSGHEADPVVLVVPNDPADATVYVRVEATLPNSTSGTAGMISREQSFTVQGTPNPAPPAPTQSDAVDDVDFVEVAPIVVEAPASAPKAKAPKAAAK